MSLGLHLYFQCPNTPLDQSFVFPLHVEQIFYLANPKERGWKIVL